MSWRRHHYPIRLPHLCSWCQNRRLWCERCIRVLFGAERSRWCESYQEQGRVGIFLRHIFLIFSVKCYQSNSHSNVCARAFFLLNPDPQSVWRGCVAGLLTRCDRNTSILSRLLLSPPLLPQYYHHNDNLCDAVVAISRLTPTLIFSSIHRSTETSETLLQQLLSFAVVGGGPTGVEFTGGLSDFIQDELLVLYPNLKVYSIPSFLSPPLIIHVTPYWLSDFIQDELMVLYPNLKVYSIPSFLFSITNTTNTLSSWRLTLDTSIYFSFIYLWHLSLTILSFSRDLLLFL